MPPDRDRDYRAPAPHDRGRSTGADRLAMFLAALGPCGFFPIAPASFASLVIAIGYVRLPVLNGVVDGAVTAIVTAVAIWASGRAEVYFGKDGGRIVIDEAAGMAVTLFLQPPGAQVALLGFFWFRVFDILKPFPGRRAERLPGGYGVVVDDLVAGVYANVAVRASLAMLGGLPLMA